MIAARTQRHPAGWGDASITSSSLQPQAVPVPCGGVLFRQSRRHRAALCAPVRPYVTSATRMHHGQLCSPLCQPRHTASAGLVVNFSRVFMALSSLDLSPSRMAGFFRCS